MVVLNNQPLLSDVQALVRLVPDFPFSVKRLIKLAREEHFPEEVVNFYKTFPTDEIFEDAEDLMARTEQIELMHHEEIRQPPDFWRTFDEN